MKLITEYTTDFEVVCEATESGKKYAIEGVFAQAEAKNRNGRIYPKRVMEQAVNKYKTEQVDTGRAVGELNHPKTPTVNLDRVSHLITDLRFEGNDVVGKASILETPMGHIVKGLLEGGVKLGVSTRGMGSLEQRGGVNFVGNDFMLNTVDIVQDPSAPGAFVNGILEGVDWVLNNEGVFEPQALEQLETEISRAPRGKRDYVAAAAFRNFLSSL